jgi:hypothetical protein
MNENNPYRSPTDPQPGEYDHSLFWRLLKISMAFMFLFAAIDCWAWYQYGPVAVERTGKVTAIAKFFTDWSAGKTPIKQAAD